MAKMMSEHQKQTDFLKRCLLYDDTAESRKLAERIAQAQQDQCRVRRGLRLMSVLAVLAVVGLCYSAVFLAYYPQSILGFTTHFITQFFCVLGLVSTICLLVFGYLGVVYRLNLDQRREQCRQFVTKVLESRMGKPAITHSHDTVADEISGTNPAAAVNGAPDKTESTANG